MSSTYRDATKWLILAVTLPALTVAAGTADAQQSDRPEEIHLRNQCRLANQILTHGRPATKREWALGFIQNCEGVGETIAEALDAHRGDQDQSPELEQLVFLTTRVVDLSVFDVALEIASDLAAGLVGRVQAIRVLYNQLYPMTVTTLEDFTNGQVQLHLPLSEPASEVEPLPTDAFELVASALEVVEADSGAPPEVRSAAGMVLRSAEATLEQRAICGSDEWTPECAELLRAARQDEP